MKLWHYTLTVFLGEHFDNLVGTTGIWRIPPMEGVEVLTISPVLKATQVLEWSSVCFSAPPFHGFFDAPNPIARPQAQWQSDHPFFSLAEAPPWTSALLLIPRLAPPFTQQAAIQHAHRRRQQQQEPSRGIFLPYSSWVMSPFRRTMLASSVLFCSYWIVLASSGSGTGNAWCT